MCMYACIGLRLHPPSLPPSLPHSLCAGRPAWNEAGGADMAPAMMVPVLFVAMYACILAAIFASACAWRGPACSLTIAASRPLYGCTGVRVRCTG